LRGPLDEDESEEQLFYETSGATCPVTRHIPGYLGLLKLFYAVHHNNMCCLFLQILFVLTESSIAIRTKAMKCLTMVVEADPAVLGRNDMQRGVRLSFLDQSTSVREAAVDLVGKFVLSRPELIDKYYDMLSTRILVRSIFATLNILISLLLTGSLVFAKPVTYSCRKYPSLHVLSYICILPSPTKSTLEINFRFSPCILTVNHFYCPTNALNYIKLRDKNLCCVSFKRQLKITPSCFGSCAIQY